MPNRATRFLKQIAGAPLSKPSGNVLGISGIEATTVNVTINNFSKPEEGQVNARINLGRDHCLHQEKASEIKTPFSFFVVLSELNLVDRDFRSLYVEKVNFSKKASAYTSAVLKRSS